MGLRAGATKVIAALLPLLAALAAGAPARGPVQPGSVAASPMIAAALRWVDAVGQGDDPEARAMATTALELAGPAAAPALAARLEAALPGEGSAEAWALGECLQSLSPTPIPSVAVRALMEALVSPSLDVRLAAASSLGALDVAAAGPALALLLGDETIPADRRVIVFLALCGSGGPEAESALRELVRNGGDESWAGATLGLMLRLGPPSASLAIEALDSGSTGTRVVALSALLLMAEPATACSLIERYGHEPEPSLRRVMLQSLAASGTPLGRDFLRWCAVVETNPELKSAARLLADSPLQSSIASQRGLVTPTRVRDVLTQLARASGQPHHVDEVERGAERAQVDLIARVLRRLPLRSDARWMEDHARLAQVRARLLCLDGLDCTP